MERQNLVEIKVLGQTFTVKADAGEPHIQEVAQYVNEKIDEILTKTKSVSSLNVAVLAALNIADDLLKDAMTLDRGRPVDDISVVVIHVSGQKSDAVRRMAVRLPIS